MQSEEQEKDKRHESKMALGDSMFWSVYALRIWLIRETSWGAIMNVSSIIRNIYLIIYEFVTKWLSLGLAWFLWNNMHYLLKRTFDDIVDSVISWIITKNNLAQIPWFKTLVISQIHLTPIIITFLQCSFRIWRIMVLQYFLDLQAAFISFLFSALLSIHIYSLGNLLYLSI